MVTATTISTVTNTTTTTTTTTVTHVAVQTGLMPSSFWYSTMGFIIVVAVILVLFGYFTWRTSVPVKVGRSSGGSRKGERKRR
ncbi:MAG: hypothetical protein OWQ54_06885 [Sulfolobaceae archaeon]|nr:hypothetical protein [Sulfolobaceae archaeon]